jgi:hypothetical protein
LPSEYVTISKNGICRTGEGQPLNDKIKENKEMYGGFFPQVGTRRPIMFMQDGQVLKPPKKINNKNYVNLMPSHAKCVN